MEDDLKALDRWAGGLLAKLAPAARRTVTRDIARELRRSQQRRIAAQRNPDESAYEPRKARAAKGGRKLRDKQGRIRRAAMFAKLRTARFIKVESDAAGLAVGFTARVSRLARVHQFGLKDRVAPHGVEYHYPARSLLGLTAQDRELIRDSLLTHITK